MPDCKENDGQCFNLMSRNRNTIIDFFVTQMYLIVDVLLCGGKATDQQPQRLETPMRFNSQTCQSIVPGGEGDVGGPEKLITIPEYKG